VYYGARHRLSPKREIGQLLVCHSVPCLFLAALYLVDIRYMQLGGAPPIPARLVLGRLFSLGFGITPTTYASIAAMSLAFGVFVLGLRWLAREDNQTWLFFAVAIVGSPALFLLGKPAYLFERYFLISFMFFLLLFSFVLGSLWRRSRRSSFAAVIVTVSVLVGNIGQIAVFERDGRGHFLDALAYIDRQSSLGEVSVCGDFDFRVRKFIRFYVPYLSGAGRFRYLEQEQLPPYGADWLLVHRLDDHQHPPPRMYDREDNAYERVQDFPAANFGGWNWHVYRNARGLAVIRDRETNERRALLPSAENQSH
jgi:hypothetical protein